jgi:hypothetical protein
MEAISYKDKRPSPIITEYDLDTVGRIFTKQWRKTQKEIEHICSAEGFIRYRGSVEDEGHVMGYYEYMQENKIKFTEMGPFDLITDNTVQRLIDYQKKLDKKIAKYVINTKDTRRIYDLL